MRLSASYIGNAKVLYFFTIEYLHWLLYLFLCEQWCKTIEREKKSTDYQNNLQVIVCIVQVAYNMETA